jgi:hypothetical protein
MQRGFGCVVSGAVPASTHTTAAAAMSADSRYIESSDSDSESDRDRADDDDVPAHLLCCG